MPKEYHSIQPLVFRLRNDQQSLCITMQTLAFPEHWKGKLHALQSHQSRRSPNESRLKIGTLNKALRALIPDLISIAPDADKQGERHWLMARQPIDPRIIYRIVVEWVRAEYAQGDPNARRWTLESLRPDDLQWKEETFDIAAWEIASNGTAKPKNRESFVLIPDMLAACLSQSDVSFQLGSDRLQFRRAPLSPGRQGAELISWPPLRKRRGRTWYFSVLITLTVQTVPFQAFPVIHCELGLRRWVSAPITYMPSGEETSVYLITRIPWLEGLQQSPSFQTAPMRWKPSQSGNEGRRYGWSSNLTPILNNLVSPQRLFPDPEKICADPVAALNLSGDQHAAIVYRNGIRPDHEVHPGVMPKKRRELTEQIADHLESLVALAQPLPKCYPTRAFRISHRPLNHQETLSQDKRYRAMIANAIGKQELSVELYVQTADARNALVHALEQLLGMTVGDAFPIQIAMPELRLNVHVEALGDLGMPLDLPNAGGSRRERLQKAIRARIEKIKARVKKEAGLVAAFVELQGKNHFQGDDDPKHAIRAGFAQVNRITQFLDVGDANLDERAKTCVLDMLRQLGVIINLPDTNRLGVKQLALVGFWMVNQRQDSAPGRTGQSLPVFVLVDSVTHQVKVFAPGLETWLLYPQALLALSNAAVNGSLKAFKKPNDATGFIQQTIRREFGAAGDVLLLTHAQNARQAWSWLSNTRITQDAIAFGSETPIPITELSKLRIIRTRDSQLSETPEWYAFHENETGFASGLFTVGERVFASVHSKPPQSKRARRGGDLDELAWNPAIIEITTTALQPGDQPGEWAAYVHELRRSLSHYSEAVILPLPIHLAKLVGEYVLGMDAREEDDKEEEYDGNV
jgi:hypothetical protein